MLSEEEKREMLEDAKSQVRRNNFRFGIQKDIISFDEYLNFLDSVQKIFGPFEVSRETTSTELNRL